MRWPRSAVRRGSTSATATSRRTWSGHAIAYVGAERARPAPGVLEGIRDADLVLICPSNPVTSVGPILAVPGIVDALARTTAPVVGVSPIVAGAPVSGPAAALMRARGLDVSPSGVAAAYAPWL